jgi:hypothetical protein
VCVCVCARARARARVCVCERERERERERECCMDIRAGNICRCCVHIRAGNHVARKHVSEHDVGLGHRQSHVIRTTRHPHQSAHAVALPKRCAAVLAMTELMDDELEILSMVPIGRYALPLTMCAGTFHSIVGADSPPGKFRHLTACRACHASQSSLQLSRASTIHVRAKQKTTQKLSLRT